VTRKRAPANAGKRQTPISERASPHSLRRTFASLRAAAGDDPVYVAEQLGHEDPTSTFRVYQRAVKRRDRLTGVYAYEFDRALAWARIGPPEGAQKALPGTGARSGARRPPFGQGRAGARTRLAKP